MKRIKPIALWFIVLGVFGAAIFVVGNSIKAENPTSVTVTLYQTELLANSGAAPITIFTSSAGTNVDIVNNPDGIFGQGSIAIGTYKRIKLTLRNEIAFTGPNPCGAGTVNMTFLMDSTLPADAQVPLYFATADDGGGSGWYNNGAITSPLLLQGPIVVQTNQTTVVKLIFNTAGALQCISGNPKILPPVMVLASYTETPSACTFPAEYWFVHFNVYAQIYDDTTGERIINPSMNDLFQRTMVISGWGTVLFNANGTWQVTQNQTYENGGNTEHRHKLASWDPAKADEGYINPSCPSCTSPLTGTYTMDGRNAIMYFPDGGYVEGSFSSDCAVIVGVNIAGLSNNSLAYGVKKPTSQPVLTGKYHIVEPHFDIKYDAVNAANYFTFMPEAGIIDVALDQSFNFVLPDDFGTTNLNLKLALPCY